MPKSHPTTNENRSSIESIENERGNVRDGKIETKTTMEWPRREKGTKEAEIEESWSIGRTAWDTVSNHTPCRVEWIAVEGEEEEKREKCNGMYLITVINLFNIKTDGRWEDWTVWDIGI